MDEDRLKPLDKLMEPAGINTAIARAYLAKGTVKQKTLADHYGDISATRLPPMVPEDIRSHFDIARNLLLYSWFVWEFRPVAQLYAFASLELALRTRVHLADAIDERDRPGLHSLLSLALERGWLDVTALSEYKLIDANQRAAFERWAAVSEDQQTALNWAPQVDPREYAAELARYMPFVRNDLAHGTAWTPGNPIGTLMTCRELIIQLFPDHVESTPQSADA